MNIKNYSVILWSDRQKTFHIEYIKKASDDGVRDFLEGKSNEWVFVAVVESERAADLAEKLLKEKG